MFISKGTGIGISNVPSLYPNIKPAVGEPVRISRYEKMRSRLMSLLKSPITMKNTFISLLKREVFCVSKSPFPYPRNTLTLPSTSLMKSMSSQLSPLKSAISIAMIELMSAVKLLRIVFCAEVPFAFPKTMFIDSVDEHTAAKSKNLSLLRLPIDISVISSAQFSMRNIIS